MRLLRHVLLFAIFVHMYNYFRLTHDCEKQSQKAHILGSFELRKFGNSSRKPPRQFIFTQ